jgi:adenine deaminase
LDELAHPSAVLVIKDGKVVAEDGELIVRLKSPIVAGHKAMQIGPISFEILAERGPARVIGIVPNQIITKALLLSPKIQDRKVVSDVDRDILKMAVVERHKATGNVGLGLVQGFGLRRGALATSVAHDSHNIAVVGATDEDMLAAVLAVKQMGGGLAAVAGGKVLASLPLPVAGLLSERGMRDVAAGIAECIAAAAGLGCRREDPFMTLSFLCLPVIPELKLTDRGLVDVREFGVVPMFMGEG